MLPGPGRCDGFVEMSAALVSGCVIFKHCPRLGSVNMQGVGGSWY